MRTTAKILVLASVAVVLAAQADLSYSQLRQFIKSSVEQKLRDKDVADYLKRQVVGFEITDGLVEEFVGWGIGPKTLKALEELQVATKTHACTGSHRTCRQGRAAPTSAAVGREADGNYRKGPQAGAGVHRRAAELTFACS